MWGGALWGGVSWGGLQSLNMPSHGHSAGAGIVAARRANQAIIRALMAQQMRQHYTSQTRDQRLMEVTAHVARMAIVDRMERAIAEQDADDLFLVLSV
jgi:hypothetical protein